ncbi:WD repeat-containing protein [Reticulomyxa filosa]|uniref:WD repeat-containing protein n=1 Tax=Reticulomyxa filosa TaxID=46433 RepID=X6PBX7_RETFI|nr:WD repeat-containing protein [Reticulomyxa filosa]|eukprot:ETO35681.1 WD repeat-containing protein [Reticulomyxa filosa]
MVNLLHRVQQIIQFEYGILKGHTNAVYDIKYFQDGQTIVSCSNDNDNTIRLWNVELGTSIQILKQNNCMCLDVSQKMKHFDQITNLSSTNCFSIFYFSFCLSKLLKNNFIFNIKKDYIMIFFYLLFKPNKKILTPKKSQQNGKNNDFFKLYKKKS